MQRPLRITLRIAAVAAAAVAVALVASTAVDAVATEVERGRIVDYGQRVEVDGREMNVVVSGSGAQTIVLLPGFGTAAPALDFAPVTELLDDDYRVVVVEPFGYGLSEGTDEPRTTANIVTEVHSALAALGIDSYVLGGHSIAGLYAIEYVERYRDEVTAFVGIDTSLPGQPGTDTAFPTGLFAAAKSLGVVRLLSALGGDPYREYGVFDPDEKAQMGMIAQRNGFAPTYLDELARISSNFADAEGSAFPPDLPLLLLVQGDNEANPAWLPLHEEQAGRQLTATLVAIDGPHYLHYTASAQIAAEIDAFLRP